MTINLDTSISQLVTAKSKHDKNQEVELHFQTIIIYILFDDC